MIYVDILQSVLLLPVKLLKSYLILLMLKNRHIKTLVFRAGQTIFGRERWLLLLARFNLVRMHGAGYERGFRYFADLLPDHGLILDIGANLGVMSAYLAQKHPSRKIIAIEPIPLHIKVMTRLFKQKRLENIKIVQKAFSNNAGFVEMKIPLQNGVLQHGLASLEIPKERAGELYQVSAMTLDEFMGNYPNEILVGIKIDVENHEWEVLNGGLQTIQKHHPMIMAELWNDPKKEQCLSLLISLGYRVVYVNVNGELVPYQGEDVLDYIFIPPSA
jgi:FkbM family methyltransferase